MHLRDIEPGVRYYDREGAVCLVLAKHPEDDHVLVVEVERVMSDSPELDYREPADFTRRCTH